MSDTKALELEWMAAILDTLTLIADNTRIPGTDACKSDFADLWERLDEAAQAESRSAREAAAKVERGESARIEDASEQD